MKKQSPAILAAPQWTLDAACAGHPEPEIFFPIVEGFQHRVPPVPAEITRLCAECPTKTDCAEFAETTAATGIYAGKNYRNGQAQ